MATATSSGLNGLNGLNGLQEERFAPGEFGDTETNVIERGSSPTWETNALLVKETGLVEAPGTSVVQVEVAIGAEVLSGEELAVRAGHETRKLFVRELVELLGRNRLATLSLRDSIPSPNGWVSARA
jgi:hypothetical protein